MTGIDILVKEHKVILKFTGYLRKICCNILEGNEIDNDIFAGCMDFARNYVDAHHHGKEEQVLFKYMLKTGTEAEKLIKYGMLAEHDLGRFFLGELEVALKSYKENPSVGKKLDIIANAAGYAALLERHIEKEDSVVYNYAKRAISERDKKIVDADIVLFEEEARVRKIQDKYVDWLESVHD